MTPHEGGPSDEGIDLDPSRLPGDVSVTGIPSSEVRDAYTHRPVEQLADRRIGGSASQQSDVEDMLFRR